MVLRMGDYFGKNSKNCIVTLNEWNGLKKLWCKFCLTGDNTALT